MNISSNRCANPTYSLITVNFRSVSALGNMLRSLPEEFFQSGEVIIVNNAIDEQSLLERIYCNFSSIRILPMSQNKGFSVACNSGAAEARGEIFIFLNPDTRFLSGSFGKWLQDLRRGERKIIAPILIQGGQEEAWSSGGPVNPFSILLHNIIPSPFFWSWIAKQRLGFVSGAALALRREDFCLLGGFCEDFFLYYEDVDLCRRAREAGMLLEKSNEAMFLHRGGLSQKEKTEQKRCYFQAQEHYLERYYGWYWVFIFRALRSIRFFFSFSV